MIRFIGDTHGNFDNFVSFRGPADVTLHVGDLGWGLGVKHDSELPGLDYAIRGNHDNPAIARAHKKYLGDWGYKEDLKLFFVSGAKSIDIYRRTEGVDYWSDEEQSYAELNYAMFEAYKAIKPRIVLSHDCPTEVAKKLVSHKVASVTNQALQAMFEYHKPDYWVFGHYHQNFVRDIGHTRFICVDKHDYYDLYL